MAPDYSRYTKAELLEALSTIDKSRFPERVEQIQAALAAINADAHNTPAPEEEILLPEPETPEEMQKNVLGTMALLFGGLIFGAMMLPVYFQSFLLDNEWVMPFTWAGWIVAGLVFIFSCRHMLRTDYLRKANARLIAKGKKPMGVNSKRRVLGAIFGAIFVGMLTGFATFRGVPVALHLYVLDTQQKSESFTVARLNHRYRKKHCNGKIYLQEYAPQFFDYVCQVIPRTRWEQLQAGDQLRLKGSRSSLGFLVTRA